ncbi:hypothetical protein [Actinokineospora pegani]|uniref:hypothetical protein n=1 Tax=Actinokineospora pegani TaxID=2654637 RepID=UPI0012EA8228|nr:hypothetical protein [Actinokineospora pegani]
MTADAPVELLRLYQGEHWTSARTLLDLAEVAGFAPRLWVASAGLGLQPVSAAFPPYAATFSPRHLDTVAPTWVDRRLWWKGLRKRIGTPALADLGGRRAVLLVLSEGYATVLKREILDLVGSADEVVLIGGAEDLPGAFRVPADGALRTELGGTMTGLNARMAGAWLSKCGHGSLISPITRGTWSRWVNKVRIEVKYERSAMTDDQVRLFIRDAMVGDPGLSRTRLHRMLRESGRACEQKRFAQLFAETMGTP